MTNDRPMYILIYQCMTSCFIWQISASKYNISSETKCLKNQPCNVIKMGEMRGEVGKKTPKEEMDNPSFLLRHMDHFWHNFNTIWALSQICRLYLLLFFFMNRNTQYFPLLEGYILLNPSGKVKDLLRDKTIYDRLIYIPNDDKHNIPLKKRVIAASLNQQN